MPQVTLNYRRLDGELATGELVPEGSVVITPVRKRNTNDGLVTTEPIYAEVGDTKIIVGGTYHFEVADRFGRPVVSEYRLVPDSGGPYAVGQLTEVPQPGKPVLTSEWKAYVDTALAPLSNLTDLSETIAEIESNAAGALAAASVAQSDAADAVAGLAGKVTAVEGKQLSTEDFSTALKAKLATVDDRANHTGTQPIESVADLPDILERRAPFNGVKHCTTELFPSLDPTGSVDSTASLQAWLDSIPDNGIGELAGGTYRARGLSVEGKTVHLRLRNAQFVQHSNGTILTITGRFDPFITVTTLDSVDVTDGGGTAPRARLTLASTPTWAPGDIVKLVSDDKIPEARPGTGGDEKRLGEFLTVDSVTGNVVVMTGALRDTGYSTNVRVARMQDDTCTIDRWVSKTPNDGLSTWTSGQLRIDNMRNPVIGEVRITQGGGFGVRFTSCFGYQINSADIRNLQNNAGLGQFGYGIYDMQCENGRVLAYTAQNVRHGWTDDTSWTAALSSDPAAYGRSRNAEVHLSAYGTRSGACDTHGAGVGHRFYVQAYGCPVAVQLRGKGHKVFDLVVRESTKGVWVFDEPDAATNMSHSHELINPDITGVRHGVHVEKLALDTTRTSLTIRGGRIVAATSPLLGNYGMIKLRGNPTFSFSAATTVGVKAIDLFVSRVEVIDQATADMRDVGSTGGNTRAVRLNDNNCRITGDGFLQVLSAGVQTRNTVAVLGTSGSEGICQVRIRGDRDFGTSVFSTCTTTSWSDYQIDTGPWLRMKHNGTSFEITGVPVTVPTPTASTDAVPKSYADTKVDKATLGYNPKDFGAVGDGVANDAPAFDNLVAAINGVGSFLASANKPLSVAIPAGTYNVKAGGIRPLLVSNVTVNCDPWSVFILRDGPIWTLGDNTTIIENFMLIGGQPKTSTTDALGSLGANCVPVYAVNAARVYIDKLRLTRCQLFKGVSNLSLSTIYLRDCTGSGLVDRNWVDIDTSANGSSGAAGLWMINCGGYGYVPPTNPTFHPKVVTGATQANPVAITATAHGFATGARVRLGGITGMTQLNGNDYTITVVDANTFTLNGVNGTAYGAYTSNSTAFAAELLWTWPYDSAVLGIKGHWDTVVIDGGLYQHWPWLWKVEATGAISFVWDEEVGWDFGGSGRFNFSLNGGSISCVKVTAGWNFTFNDDWIKIAAPGAGVITDLTVRGHTLGMTGKSFINDSALDKIINLEVDGLRVMGCGRARVGTSYLIYPGNTGNNVSTIRGVRMENPGGYFVNPQFMLPDVAVKLSPQLRWTCTDNEVAVATGGTNYDIPLSTATAAGSRLLRSNKRRDGALPEYYSTATATMPASGVATTNHSGLTQTVFLYGGTMTAISKNGVQVANGEHGPFNFDVGPGENWSCTYTSTAPTLVVSYKD